MNRKFLGNGADLRKEARLVIIDEISMLDKKILTAIDEHLRELCNADEPFGGKVILLGGDPQQLVPPSGADKSIYGSAEHMSCFHHLQLKQQMRQKDDPEFSKLLEDVGKGKLKYVKFPAKNRVDSLEELLTFTFGPTLTEHTTSAVVVAPRVTEAYEINERAIQLLSGTETILESRDTPIKPGENPLDDDDEGHEHNPPKILKVAEILIKNK